MLCAELPRSEAGYLKSDLRGRGKSIFLEGPEIYFETVEGCI